MFQENIFQVFIRGRHLKERIYIRRIRSVCISGSFRMYSYTWPDFSLEAKTARKLKWCLVKQMSSQGNCW